MRRRQGPNRSHGASPSALDAGAQEAVARFVRVLARCRCTPQQIAQEVLKACRQVPSSWAQTPKAAVSEMDAAAHVLTLWFQDPAYLDSKGNPQPLRSHGGERSLEALARQVDPKLDVDKILAHLLRRAVLRRSGPLYLPRDRVLMFRGSGPPYHARSLRALVAMLGTLEHNARPRRSTPGWYEVFAVNARVPLSAIPEFDRWLRRHGDRLLEQADGKLHGYEQKRREGERTVHIGAGLYRIGEDAPPPKRRTRRLKPGRN
jgi:Family of unknown function (DUF6502)